jgi:hypothetical protein
MDVIWERNDPLHVKYYVPMSEDFSPAVKAHRWENRDSVTEPQV